MGKKTEINEEVEINEETEINEQKEQKEQQEKMEKLEVDTASRLEKVFGDTPTPDSAQDSTQDSTKDTVKSDSTPDETQKSEKDVDSTLEDKTLAEETKDESVAAEEKSGKKPADDASELTQAEIRAAIHLGWTKEEITELAEANPELAKKTCAKALTSTNDLSKKFSELGKKVKDDQTNESVEQKSGNIPGKTAVKPVDLSGLDESYADDPLLPVLKQLAEQNQHLAEQIQGLGSSAVNAEKVRVDESVQKARAAEDAAVSQQIDVFFSDSGMEDYGELYGVTPKGAKDWDHLTQGQVKNRLKVVEEANLILIGAESMGTDMSLEDAFERAHLTVVAPVQERVIREKIKASVVKRSKGLTLKPISSNKVPTSGTPTPAELEARTSQRLRKTFG